VDPIGEPRGKIVKSRGSVFLGRVVGIAFFGKADVTFITWGKSCLIQPDFDSSVTHLQVAKPEPGPSRATSPDLCPIGMLVSVLKFLPETPLSLAEAESGLGLGVGERTTGYGHQETGGIRGFVVSESSRETGSLHCT
jgi:hypothetical protein